MQLPHGTWCWYWVVKDFDDDGSHESCLHWTRSKSAYMTKVKRRWYSVFVKLALSRSFLLSASGSLILFALCSLHLSQEFFNTSSLLQQCKQKHLVFLSLVYCLSTSLLKSFTNTQLDVLPTVIYYKFMYVLQWSR